MSLSKPVAHLIYVICLLLCLGAIGLAGCSHSRAADGDPVHAPLPPETELLPQPAFAKGFKYFGRGKCKMEGAVPVLTLDGGVFAIAGALIGIPTHTAHDDEVQLIPVKQLPWNQPLVFSGRLKGTTANQTAAVRAYAAAEDTHVLQSWQIETPLTTVDWKPFALALNLPPRSHALQVFVINGDQKQILLSSLSVKTKGEFVPASAASPASSLADTAPTVRPGDCALLHVRLQAPVKTRKPGQTGTVSFPIGGSYPDQFLVAFHAESEPAGAIKGIRWRKRPQNSDWVCDVSVTPPKGAIIRWDGLFLVRKAQLPVLPRAFSPEVPSAVTSWTHGSAAVQSDNAVIIAQARKLGENAPDVETYARRVIAFTAGVPAIGMGWKSLDALAGLKYGGTCTNRANLAAALLRAHGVPARTVAHLPSWSREPLYEHWLVEYWHPKTGWVWIEPTLGKFLPGRTSAAVLAVSTLSDEDRAFEPLHCRYVMPGAAYLSVAEFSPMLYPADLFRDDATNTIATVSVLHGTSTQQSALCTGARRLTDALFRRAAAGIALPDNRDAIARSANPGSAADLNREINALTTAYRSPKQISAQNALGQNNYFRRQ